MVANYRRLDLKRDDFYNCFLARVVLWVLHQLSAPVGASYHSSVSSCESFEWEEAAVVDLT